MSLRKPVVLLCCGCFNPVTNKHLRIMELARDAIHKTGKYKVLEGVYSPAHDKYGKKDLIAATHRAEMLKLAVKSNNWLRVDTWEIEQAEWTQTQIVLTRFKDYYTKKFTDELQAEEINASPKAKRRKSEVRESCPISSDSVVPEIRLVCGADVLESFSVPGLWKPEHQESILRDFGLVVLQRIGSDAEKFIYENDLLTKYADNILIVTDWFLDDFSSTKVRRALRRNESVRYVIPDTVLEYVHDNKLYNPEYNNHLGKEADQF